MTTKDQKLKPGFIEIMEDPIEDYLEELAALAVAWQQLHDRKRPSSILRQSLINAATALVGLVKLNSR